MIILRQKQYNKSTMFCGIATRKCIEQAVHWMYSVDGDLKMPYDDSIQVLVHDSEFVQIVPGNIQKDIQIAIKLGDNDWKLSKINDVDDRIISASWNSKIKNKYYSDIIIYTNTKDNKIVSIVTKNSIDL